MPKGTRATDWRAVAADEEARERAKAAFEKHNSDSGNLDVLERCRRLNEFLSKDFMKPGQGANKAELQEILALLSAGNTKRPAFLDKPSIFQSTPSNIKAAKRSPAPAAVPNIPGFGGLAALGDFDADRLLDLVDMDDEGSQGPSARPSSSDRTSSVGSRPSSTSASAAPPIAPEEVDDLIGLLNVDAQLTDQQQRQYRHRQQQRDKKEQNSDCREQQEEEQRQQKQRQQELQEQQKAAEEQQQQQQQKQKAAEEQQRQQQQQQKQRQEEEQRQRLLKQQQQEEQHRQLLKQQEEEQRQLEVKQQQEEEQRQRLLKQQQEEKQRQLRKQQEEEQQRQQQLKKQQEEEQHRLLKQQQEEEQRQRRLLEAVCLIQSAVRALHGRRAHTRLRTLYALRRAQAARAIQAAWRAWSSVPENVWKLRPLRATTSAHNQHRPRPASAAPASLSQLVHVRSQGDQRLAPRECCNGSGGGGGKGEEDVRGRREPAQRTVSGVHARSCTVRRDEVKQRGDVATRAVMAGSEHRSGAAAIEAARRGSIV